MLIELKKKVLHILQSNSLGLQIPQNKNLDVLGGFHKRGTHLLHLKDFIDRTL